MEEEGGPSPRMEWGLRMARYKTITRKAQMRMSHLRKVKRYHMGSLQQEGFCDSCGKATTGFFVNGLVLCSGCTQKATRFAEPKSSIKSMLRPLNRKQRAMVGYLALLIASGVLLFLLAIHLGAMPALDLSSIFVLVWKGSSAAYLWISTGPLITGYGLWHLGALMVGQSTQAWSTFQGLPFRTISPKGLSTSGVVLRNNGSHYGPDGGPGGLTTTNQGWDLALSYLATQGGGTIFARFGTWTLSNALDANNNLISIPLIGSSDTTTPVHFNIVGEACVFRQQEIDGAQPSTGSILYGTTTTGATSSPNINAAAILGCPSGGGSTGQNNVEVSLYNMVIMSPSNPTLSGINFQYVMQTEIDNVICDVNEVWSNSTWTTPTNVAAVGYIGSSKGSPNTCVGMMQFTGYYLGWWMPEDTFAETITCIGDFVGVANQPEDNPIFISRLDIEWCAHMFGSSVYNMTTLTHTYGPNQNIHIGTAILPGAPTGFPLQLVDTIYASTASGSIPPITFGTLHFGNSGSGPTTFSAGWVGSPIVTILNDGTGAMTVAGKVTANGTLLGGGGGATTHPQGAYPYCAYSPKYLNPTLQGQLYLNTALSNIAAGTSPIGVVCTPDGKYAYISNSGSANVSVIQIATQTVVATVSVGSLPRGMCATPDGRYVYVCNQGSGSAGTTVSVIATATNTVIATVTVGTGPYTCAATPDGSNVLVVNNSTNNVSVISVATNTVTSTITVGSNPDRMAIDPAGVYAYVGNTVSNTVSVITIATGAVTSITGFSVPEGIAVTPNGEFVYVANNGNGTVSVVSTQTQAIVTTVTVGSSPQGIATTPDGNYVYVVNNGGTTLSVISTATNAVVLSPTISSGSYGIDITPDGKFAYVASYTGATVNVFRLSTNNLVLQTLTGQTTTSTTAPGASMGSITFTAGFTGKVYLKLVVRANNNTIGDGVTIGLYNGATALDTETYTQEGLAGNSETFDLRYVLSVTAGTSYTVYGYMLAVTGGTVTAKLVELSAGPVA